MAKSLQEQMLEMGLVNQKKAKKNAKEMKKTAHKRRTGDDADLEDTRAAAEAARKAKAEKDRELNRQREEAAQQKAIVAQIRQLIQTNTIEANGDIKYNFVAANKKVKQLYVNQAVWDRLSRGQLAIIELEGEAEETFRIVPLPVSEKVLQRAPDHFVLIADAQGDEMDEDDPYAAYKIPDDLMW